MLWQVKILNETNKLIELFSNMSLSDYGNWSSVIGGCVSTITLFLVLFMKNKFMFRSRVEEHESSLSNISSKISNLLQSYSENQHEIESSFAIANVTLRTIQKGASGNLSSDVKKARRKIMFYRFKSWVNASRFKPDELSARKVKTELSVVVEELKNVKKELLVGK